jgi:HlyD family secretion protein
MRSLVPVGSPWEGKTRRSIRRHMALGCLAIVFLLGSLSFWAARAQFAGAIIAHGALVVNSHSKKIQHPSGGVIRRVYIQNGSVVKAGEVLITLDDTLTRANLSLIDKGLTELVVKRTRLIAERDGADKMIYPSKDGLALDIADRAIHDEMALFAARRSVNLSVKAQLRERIEQTREELAGLQSQLEAKSGEISLVETELKGARDLWTKSLMPITKYTALQREVVRLGGERGQLMSSIASAKGKITETELKILQIDQDLGGEVGKELREVDFRINELAERKVAAEDQLGRTNIIAPQAGVVHELAVFTAGGVIGTGDTLMLIIPQAEPLIAEVRIQPQDIDQIGVGQGARLRFAAFNQNTTPDYEGTLRHVGADLTSDPHTGALFYTARIELDHDEALGAAELKLVPGMPVDAFIETDERTVISYLLKPLTDQIVRAFRDG